MGQILVAESVILTIPGTLSRKLTILPRTELCASGGVVVVVFFFFFFFYYGCETLFLEAESNVDQILDGRLSDLSGQLSLSIGPLPFFSDPVPPGKEWELDEGLVPHEVSPSLEGDSGSS